MKNKIIPLLLFCVFILATALRAQELVSHNYLFLLDQGRDMMAVKGILYDHHLTLIGPYTSLEGVFQGPIWYYLLAIPTFIFRGDPWGSIVLMFVISLGTFAGAYFWSKKLFGETAGLFIAFLFAISPEAIAAATFSWNPHPMWLLLTLYIFVFFTLMQGKKRMHLFLWPLIALMFHFETALAVFILLATIIYLLLFQRNIFRTRLCFYGLLIAAIFFLPQFLFDLRHQFLMTKSILHVFAGGKQGLAVGGEKTGYGILALQHAQAFFDNFSSSFVQEGYLENIGKIMLAFILAVTVFARGKMKKKERQFVFFIIRLVIIIFVLTFSYPFAIRYWFLTGFQSFFLLLSGLLLAVFSRFRFGKPLVILACLVFLFYSFIRLDRLYVHPPDDGGTQKTKGKLAAIDYIYKDAAGKPFGLLAFTPPVYTDAYDYLVWWRGTNIYHYVPTKDKKETFYLLIEPDSAKPWSYKGWLETVIKVGTVEKTVTLHSGFIVQKRTL